MMAEMLAVVGALSSVLQVIDFAAKVVSHTHDILATGKETESGNDETERLLVDYRVLFENRRNVYRNQATQTVFGQAASTPASPLTEGEYNVAEVSESCREKTEILLGKLAGLKLDTKSRGFKKVFEATRKATKAVTTRKEVEDAQKMIREVNGQLATALLQEILARQKARAGPSEQALGAASKMSGAQLENTVAFLHKCKRMNHIIEHLGFDEMNTRHDAIEPAFEGTYSWILENEGWPLRQWLLHGSGIFWITGKAGSGKTTLVKHLCKQQRTIDLLAGCRHCDSCNQDPPQRAANLSILSLLPFTSGFLVPRCKSLPWD
jgi:hypothetical protein